MACSLLSSIQVHNLTGKGSPAPCSPTLPDVIYFIFDNLTHHIQAWKTGRGLDDVVSSCGCFFRSRSSAHLSHSHSGYPSLKIQALPSAQKHLACSCAQFDPCTRGSIPVIRQGNAWTCRLSIGPASLPEERFPDNMPILQAHQCQTVRKPFTGRFYLRETTMNCSADVSI